MRLYRRATPWYAAALRHAVLRRSDKFSPAGSGRARTNCGAVAGRNFVPSQDSTSAHDREASSCSFITYSCLLVFFAARGRTLAHCEISGREPVNSLAVLMGSNGLLQLKVKCFGSSTNKLQLELATQVSEFLTGSAVTQTGGVKYRLLKM